jgi:hypothetical protein
MVTQIASQQEPDPQEETVGDNSEELKEGDRKADPDIDMVSGLCYTL